MQMIRSQVTKLMVVGSLSPTVSGTVILLQQLLDDLQRGGNIEVDVLDTAGMRGRGFRALVRYLRLCVVLPWRARGADVLSVQVMGTAVPYLIPPVLLALLLARKPAMLRLFGGWDFRGDPAPLRRLCLWFLNRFDLVVVETRLMEEALGAAGVRRLEVFYNNRRMPAAEDPPLRLGPARRFIYLSHVRPEKGVRLLVEAAKAMPPGVEISVYGPFFGDLSEATFAGLPNLRYCGVAAPGDVQRILAEHDALLLPTFFEHEGHPGIILESFAVGIPVIATRWRALPELFVEDSGLLIEPRSVPALVSAMLALATDSALYQRLAAGAYHRRIEFSAEKWCGVFERYIERLARPAVRK